MRRLAALSLLALISCHRRSAPVHVETLGSESTVLPRVAYTTGTATSMMRTIHVGDRDREYLLVEPPASADKLPLVLVFHGDGGDARGFHDAFPFERVTGNDAIVAYPDGIGSTWDLESILANRDVAFIDALIDALPIDRSRVFLTGYSSGGFMSNVYACQKSSRVRAIASSAGGAPYKQGLVWPNGYPRCPGQAPVATLALHGDSDYGVTLDSGRFSAAYWAYVNGCKTDEMETTGYPECHAYRGCPAGKAVGFCEVPGLGHWVWDHAAEASWTFFRTQSRQ